MGLADNVSHVLPGGQLNSGVVVQKLVFPAGPHQWLIKPLSMAPPATSGSNKSISSTIAGYEKQLDQALAKYPSMLKLERKLGIPKARIVAVAGLAIFGYGLLHLAAPVVMALIVFGYPALMTMKAMESGQKSEHSLWLAYWISAAFLHMFEVFTFGGLSRIVPFYLILKIALHMWLYLPITQGALTFYEAALRPLYKGMMGNPQFAAATEKFATAANSLAADAKKASERLGEKVATTAKDVKDLKDE